MHGRPPLAAAITPCIQPLKAAGGGATGRSAHQEMERHHHHRAADLQHHTQKCGPADAGLQARAARRLDLVECVASGKKRVFALIWAGSARSAALKGVLVGVAVVLAAAVLIFYLSHLSQRAPVQISIAAGGLNGAYRRLVGVKLVPQQIRVRWLWCKRLATAGVDRCAPASPCCRPG
jgi:hypothetical protein